MDDYEMNALLFKSKEAWARTQVVVKRVLGEKHTLQWMSLIDRKRLTVLLVWEQRYKISLEWIVETLLNHYQGKRKRIITGRRYRNPALPVRTVTLVSPTSREIIEKELQQSFPDDEHINIWRERERYKFLAKELAPEESAKVIGRTFLDFADTKEFVDEYSRTVEKHRSAADTLTAKHKNKKPYRNSPWR